MWKNYKVWECLRSLSRTSYPLKANNRCFLHYQIFHSVLNSQKWHSYECEQKRQPSGNTSSDPSKLKNFKGQIFMTSCIIILFVNPFKDLIRVIPRWEPLSNSCKLIDQKTASLENKTHKERKVKRVEQRL